MTIIPEDFFLISTCVIYDLIYNKIEDTGILQILMNMYCLFVWWCLTPFTTTYGISAYQYWCCEFESSSGRGVQHYVIKFGSYLGQVGGFLWVLRFPTPITLTATIITQICSKVTPAWGRRTVGLIIIT
jgi:hypothetical protein